MKKSVMKKWVKALRSGKYKQTKKKLKDENGFCCLGVLCDISEKGQWKGDARGDYHYVLNSGSEYAWLPWEITTWAGMDGADGRIEGFKNNLPALNDHKKWSFNAIANYIEKYWEKL